jgi:hypothetical protein
MNKEEDKKGTSRPVSRIDLLRPFAGKWVILTHDETEVVGSGSSLKEALQGTAENRMEDVVATFVPCMATAMVL